MVSPLENAIGFLQNFGFFDIVLPFLLVFVIVFAVLEKTRIFGTEEFEGKQYPKKNINSMVAFVIALFVVVTKQVVVSIQVSLPKIALILVAIIGFMILAGSFVENKEFSLKGASAKLLTAIVFIAVLAIIFDSIGWLDFILDYIKDKWKDTFIVSLIFLFVVVGTIIYVTKSNVPVKKEEEK